MEIFTSDILVPVVVTENEHGDITSHCSLCGGTIGRDYNYRDMPHTLQECLARLRDRLKILNFDW